MKTYIYGTILYMCTIIFKVFEKIFSTLREAFKPQIWAKLGHCPTRVGGWLSMDIYIYFEVIIN